MQHSQLHDYPWPLVTRATFPYVYNAIVVTVHDGDTLTLGVDLGFDLRDTVPFRLLGCNARELSQEGGPEARDHLAALLPPFARVKIASVKPDKFGGRYDAAVLLADGTDVVAQLVDQQWAAAWDGTGTKPVPPWPRTVTP
jgi:endonuclease YncB( thermonuclease family)